MPELAENNQALESLIYGRRVMRFYEQLLQGPVLHYVFTWFRPVGERAQTSDSLLWDGKLGKDPVNLRKKLGGRWLTAEFEAGDMVTFCMTLVHGSLDNQTDQIRLSSDSRYQLATEAVDDRWI